MSADDRYPTALAGQVGFLLARAHLVAREQADTALARLGLTMKGYASLATLESVGSVSQQKLSRLIGMDPATMVDVIDSLEESGHLSRVRNPEDRREYSLRVTPKGRRLFGRAEAAIAEAETVTLGGMKAEDRRALMHLLGRIAGARADGTPATDEMVNRALGR